MPCVWCLVPGSYQTTRRQRPLTAPIHDRSIAENSINLILSRHLPTIDADPTQMRRLLQNLIGNALKFHRPEAPPLVKISAKRLDSPERGQRYQILVEDNGIGFDEKYLDRIFTPFQRLYSQGKYEGTGIGLAICRKIVERHGGSITAKSRPGQGATFIVTLPVKQTRGEQ